MRKLDPVKFEAKRQEILMAAGSCFFRSGLKGASISDICQEAKISPGHLYHYFESKGAIIAALADLRLEATAEHFAKTLGGDGRIMDILIDEMTRSEPEGGGPLGALLFELFAEASRSAEMASILGGHSLKIRALLADFLRQGQARGEIDASLDPQTTAEVLIGVVDGLRALGQRYPRTDSAEVLPLYTLLVQRFLAPAG